MQFFDLTIPLLGSYLKEIVMKGYHRCKTYPYTDEVTAKTLPCTGHFLVHISLFTRYFFLLGHRICDAFLPLLSLLFNIFLEKKKASLSY